MSWGLGGLREAVLVAGIVKLKTSITAFSRAFEGVIFEQWLGLDGGGVVGAFWCWLRMIFCGRFEHLGSLLVFGGR